MSIPQSGGGPIERFDQLAEYLAAGCKPEADWRIGTEHEKFGYRARRRTRRCPTTGACSVHAMLAGLRDRFGWAPVEEAGKLIGLQKGGANVSLEPGGQLELSGATLRTIHETCDEVNAHLRRGEGDRRRDRRRLHRPRRGARVDGAADAGDAEGPLRADDPLHARGRQPRHADDVPDLHRAGEPRLRLRGRHGEEVPRRAGAAAGGDGALRLLAVLRGQGERLAVVAGADLAGHRPGAHRHAALRLRGRHGLRALRRLRARRADVLRLPRRPLHRRARPVVPRLPRRAAAGAARREADALGLGRPSDDDLPRGAAQALHGDARRRRRALAADLRAAGALGRAALRRSRRSTPPGTSAATGPPRSATGCATTPASTGSAPRSAAARCATVAAEVLDVAEAGLEGAGAAGRRRA